MRVAYQTTCARDHEYEGIDDVDDDIDRYDEIVETIATSSHQAQGGGEWVPLPHLGALCPGWSHLESK